MDKSIEFKDDKIFAMHNSMIEARYKMNLNEIKLFVALVSLIQREDKEFTEYSISAEEIAKFLNIKDKNDIYYDIKRTARSLVRKTIFVENRKMLQWSEYPLFSKMEYKDGVLHAKFNVEISPFLLQLKENFTKFKLEELKSFDSKYSIRIYELLKQYQRIGERTFDIDDLRLRLGVEDGELIRISNFKKRILDIAQRELADTLMAFDYTMIKTGKKFTKVKFTLRHKWNINNGEDIIDAESDDDMELQKTSSTDSNPQKTLKDIYDLVPEDQMTQSLEQVIQNYFSLKGFDYLKNAIEYTNKQNPKNYLAYLKSALENNYAEVMVKEKEIESKRKEEEDRKKRIADIEYKIHELKVREGNEVDKTAKALFDSLPEKVREMITSKAKAVLLTENSNENVEGKDPVVRVKLWIEIASIVEEIYPDKFQDIHGKYAGLIKMLESELQSIRYSS